MQPVRGTHDFLPEAYRSFQGIIDLARCQLKCYGFQEMATPLFEYKEVFQRTSGAFSDIVSKEMYEVIDRGGGENFVLRPEGTAPVMRAILSNGLKQNLPLKFFYQGPMFRYDRPQRGRMRQFHQVGAEYVGEKEPFADVEVMACGMAFLESLGVTSSLTLELNTLGDRESRLRYRKELAAYFEKFRDALSKESQARLEKNPLRILDSKSPVDQEIGAGAPLMIDFLTQDAASFFEGVQRGLKSLGISYKLNPRLVRGLDYYSHTAFEVVSTDLGAQGTVLAGGRYDYLMECLGGPPMPGVGWAAGVERLLILSGQKSQTPDKICLLSTDADGILEGLCLARDLRQWGFIVDLMGCGNLGRKIKKADKMGYAVVLILGEAERESQGVTLKRLKTGEQKMVLRKALKRTLEDLSLTQIVKG